MGKTLGIIVFLILFLSCIKKSKEEQFVVSLTKGFKLKNGVLFYNEEAYTGVLLSFDKVNKTNNTSEYKEGKKHGKELKKYQNEVLAEERFYTKGNKSGVHKGWWKNGGLKFEYHFNTTGEYHGIVREWYKNGQPCKFFNYEEGKEKGSQQMWQPNGKLRANYIVKNGDRFGLIGLKKCYTVNTIDEKIN
ncbi:conserved hypothetical protein [Tenacibaculum sp. 190524A02b]|uniref:Toxin-antitoxin system YwqK family antitoxin n=1 Tax=Tenacibaculum vairaonense TaxID=3137860 RepID=A0ABM9PRZ1_9FLAO